MLDAIAAVVPRLPAKKSAVEEPYSFPPEVLTATATWIRQFSLAWHSETPQTINTSQFEGDGLQFSPEFIGWIERPCDGRAWCSNPKCEIEPRKHHCHDLSCSHGMRRYNDPRHRTHRAFRRLRRAAPREFDAMYLLCAQGMSFGDVARAMTERAIRINKPERYSEGSVLVLAISAVDKLSRWY